jgi:methylglutaconyl-CoA hydratase
MQKGLYASVHESTLALDTAVQLFAENLCTYNPEAMAEMKKVMWAGTEHWDTLLKDRAVISGRLVLSDFTKKTLKTYR